MSFDAQRCYRISPAVTLRPEPFGALAYHFGQRRLTYLSSGNLVAVISELQAGSGQRNAAEAMDAAGVPSGQRLPIERALGNLVDRGVLDAV